jgi:hypothetical protein
MGGVKLGLIRLNKYRSKRSSEKKRMLKIDKLKLQKSRHSEN